MNSSRTATYYSFPTSSIIALWMTAFLCSYTTHVSGSNAVRIATADAVTHSPRLAHPLNLTAVLAGMKFSRADPLTAMPAVASNKRYHLISHARASSPTFDISWHGGSLFTALVKVNLIFYGGGWSQTQQNIITEFFNSFSRRKGSGGLPGLGQWWKIHHPYRDGVRGVSPILKLGTVISDPNSVGNTIGGDSVIQRIVSDAISGGHIGGFGASEMTHVLVSDDVAVDGFCTQMCGYHNMFYLDGRQVIYGFIGMPPKSGCRGCQSAFLLKNMGGSGWTPPNGDAGIDSLISALAHETAEVATDPDTLAGYYQNSNGMENADFCAYYYGNVFSSNPNDASPIAFNVLGLSGRKYLIQTNYDLVKKMCVNYR